MIRVTQTATLLPVDDFAAFLNGYQDASIDAFFDALEIIRPQALRELSVTPGPVQYPIAWTSEKQRRAFYATDGFGSGIPFIRATNAPGNVQGSWYMKAQVNGVDVSAQTSLIGLDGDTALSAQIGNKSPSSKYVYGSLAKTNPGRFQQLFHRNTGWITAYPVVQFWMNAFFVLWRENARKAYKERTLEFNRRGRAYTAPRRRQR